MIDRSLLDQALFEFVVLADTHEMLPSSDASLEMKSRDWQSERTKRALELIDSIRPDFVVHLGDLVQEFPESPGFAQSLDRALSRIQHSAVPFRHVAGNHDVGDKPDPTMPTAWVTQDALDAYRLRLGRSWYSWDAHGWHFIVLNSQILNSELPAEREQCEWLEDDLQKTSDRPTMVFLHMAPYLVNPDELWLGHYDNIAEPARSWLLDQVRAANVFFVFAGHSHFQFINRLAEAKLLVTPSVSFTRPGFCEAFSSAPPAEQGRDDAPKLGFFLVRVRQESASVQLIRTSGNRSGPRDEQIIVTSTPRELPRSQLGVVSRHSLAPTGYLPLAWPTLTRQPMRNDYPLLATLELGARHVRVPVHDLSDPVQRERLELLRDEGIGAVATCIWTPEASLEQALSAARDLARCVEVQLPGVLFPDARTLEQLFEIDLEEMVVAPLMPREIVPGKQHARARTGYRVEELPQLDDHLVRLGATLPRIACRVDPGNRAWETMIRAMELTLSRIEAIDWLIEFGTLDEHEQVVKVVESMIEASQMPRSRVFLDPLVDLDRTMDVTFGLLDRQYNPRRAFSAARVLNSLLWGGKVDREPPQLVESELCEDGRRITLRSASYRDAVWLPNTIENGPVSYVRTTISGPKYREKARMYDLASGTSRDL